jgi:hypothetical protein
LVLILRSDSELEVLLVLVLFSVEAAIVAKNVYKFLKFIQKFAGYKRWPCQYMELQSLAREEPPQPSGTKTDEARTMITRPLEKHHER